MTVEELHLLLTKTSASPVRFRLPDGNLIPEHFHVTEVGRVDKNFIDCGGTRRHVASCLLQTWVATDVDHRLSAGKLAGILKLAEPILGSMLLPVEVEHGEQVAAQYSITDFDLADEGLIFVLTGKQTQCLAPDLCGIPGCDPKAGCC